MHSRLRAGGGGRGVGTMAPLEAEGGEKDARARAPRISRCYRPLPDTAEAAASGSARGLYAYVRKKMFITSQSRCVDHCVAAVAASMWNLCEYVRARAGNASSRRPRLRTRLTFADALLVLEAAMHRREGESGGGFR